MSTTDLTPATENVILYRGDTWVESWLVTNNSLAVDLSAADVLLQIRRKKGGDILYTSEIGTGITISGVDDNSIDHFGEVDIIPGTWYWDIQITLPSGQIFTGKAGTCQVIDDVSRV